MGRHRKPPRVQKWRGAWYLFFHDPNTGKNLRKSCHVLGAHDAESRQELVRQKTAELRTLEAEIVRKGGQVGYDARLVDKLKVFVDEVERTGSSGSGQLKQDSIVQLSGSINRFIDWLEASPHSKVPTGRLDPSVLSEYLKVLSEQPGKRGDKVSIATLNKHRRNIRTAITNLNGKTPPLFTNFDALTKALRQDTALESDPTAFSPTELKSMYAALKAWEADNKQRVSAQQSQQSRIFLFLALTGCRLKECLALTWNDVDLKNSVVTFGLQLKKGRRRRLPLTSAPELKICPEFAKTLKRWAKGRSSSDWVICPAKDRDKPIVDNAAWRTASSKTGLASLTPQMLRQNFTSYCASLGVPASVAAQWQGHSQQVAEKFYRALVPERDDGDSLEAAIGLSEFARAA